MQVAQTILEQLGGRQFIVMTGAKKFIGSSNSLSMKLPKCKNNINSLRIELNGEDLYDLYFYSGFNLVMELNSIYAEDLKDCFERETGLYVTLFPRRS